jgi:hypothetical protein
MIYADNGERASVADLMGEAFVMSIILYPILFATFHLMQWFLEVVIPYYLGDFFSLFKEASDEKFKPQSGI